MTTHAGTIEIPPNRPVRAGRTHRRDIIHPDLESEQQYLDHAHACVEDARALARRLSANLEVGAGGTNQARFERDAFTENILDRLQQLDIGDASLVFGRIDHDEVHDDSLYIGRVGVWDRSQDPVVVDWRAPASEPFYRATGAEPLGLERRRHFATRQKTLLDIDDEFFGDLDRLDEQFAAGKIQGHGALITALETARTGRLGDIVATIQGEQDEIIRAPLQGLLVVQGGPGTGKTVVALHRAAYLLYSHRFPLHDQGVLIIGPNRLFLAYIEQVLPSLGEAGVRLSVLSDLVVPRVRTDRLDSDAASATKGDLRMVELIRRSVRQRERPIREDLVVGYGLQNLRLTVFESEMIIKEAQRRYRTHNAARKFVETEVFASLANSGREEVDAQELRDRIRRTMPLRETLEWMWPALSPAGLLHDLFRSPGLLQAAGRGLFSSNELEPLHREPGVHVDKMIWSFSDAPLLDEARSHLGARPGKKSTDEVRTFGHIVIDEAQDLSPMELRMISRRSLNGSMTVVGDIAQATGSWAREEWDELIEQLPQSSKHPPVRRELTTGYRIPAPAMELAARVLTEAAPGLTPPVAIRHEGAAPVLRQVHDLAAELPNAVRAELAEIDAGNVAVIVPRSLLEPLTQALADADVSFGGATRSGLDKQVTIVPVQLVKGLEVDATLVVEPARIVREEAQGMRSLYVALTRATKRVGVLHTEPLPAVMVDDA
ncbi:MAG: DNA helicase IV [Verrucomicrobiales bacterium]